MGLQERIGKAVARGQRRLPTAVLRRRHGEPPTVDGHTLDLQTHAYAELVKAAQLELIKKLLLDGREPLKKRLLHWRVFE